jgi:hypothetical protein
LPVDARVEEPSLVWRDLEVLPAVWLHARRGAGWFGCAFDLEAEVAAGWAGIAVDRCGCPGVALDVAHVAGVR